MAAFIGPVVPDAIHHEAEDIVRHDGGLAGGGEHPHQVVHDFRIGLLPGDDFNSQAAPRGREEMSHRGPLGLFHRREDAVGGDGTGVGSDDRLGADHGFYWANIFCFTGMFSVAASITRSQSLIVP